MGDQGPAFYPGPGARKCGKTPPDPLADVAFVPGGDWGPQGFVPAPVFVPKVARSPPNPGPAPLAEAAEAHTVPVGPRPPSPPLPSTNPQGQSQGGSLPPLETQVDAYQ